MTDGQFICYMAVNTLVGIGTIGAVIVALFGHRIRLRYWPPNLIVELFDPKGELTRDRCPPPYDFEQVRYYHLRVSNARRFSPATNVSLHILAVDEEGADKELERAWNGNVQLRWRHMAAYPSQTQVVGKSIDFDLISVSEHTNALKIHTIAAPSTFPKDNTRECHFRIWIQVQCNEVDCEVISVEFFGDGEWDKNDNEMQKHVKIKLGK